jgi:hypothetical protein
MARSKAADTAEERDPPGKPQSQIDAEAPPDEATAAAWQEEYESRVPMAMYETGEPAPAEEVPARKSTAADSGL